MVAVPVHVPFVPVSTAPTVVEPLIAGATVLAGADGDTAGEEAPKSIGDRVAQNIDSALPQQDK
jgi:hypothetical protein